MKPALGGKVDMKSGMRPVHPGEILGEEIEAAGISEGALSKALDVPLRQVTQILAGREGSWPIQLCG